jgi:hypothetical protein
MKKISTCFNDEGNFSFISAINFAKYLINYVDSTSDLIMSVETFSDTEISIHIKVKDCPTIFYIHSLKNKNGNFTYNSGNDNFVDIHIQSSKDCLKVLKFISSNIKEIKDVISHYVQKNNDKKIALDYALEMFEHLAIVQNRTLSVIEIEDGFITTLKSEDTETSFMTITGTLCLMKLNSNVFIENYLMIYKDVDNWNKKEDFHDEWKRFEFAPLHKEHSSAFFKTLIYQFIRD